MHQLSLSNGRSRDESGLNAKRRRPQQSHAIRNALSSTVNEVLYPLYGPILYRHLSLIDAELRLIVTCSPRQMRMCNYRQLLHRLLQLFISNCTIIFHPSLAPQMDHIIDSLFLFIRVSLSHYIIYPLLNYRHTSSAVGS
jgi:hypothetical protein